MNDTWMVLLAYAVVMFGATVLMTKKEDSVERFCVGGRNAGWAVSALSIAATWIWAPALFKSAESAYTTVLAVLSGIIYTVCKTDQKRNAGRDHPFRVYV